jgi:hypothetical protein
VPLTRLQSELLRTLADQRSPDSHIAGGIALNRDGPRFSGDIDIFHDDQDRLFAIGEHDGAVLTDAGFRVEWLPGRGTGKRTALVHGLAETTQLEWVADDSPALAVAAGPRRPGSERPCWSGMRRDRGVFERRTCRRRRAA